MNTKFKAGDFVYCSFELYQIKEVITEKKNPWDYHVTNGYVETSANDEGVFPVTLQNKIISEEYEHWEDKLRQHPGDRHLNWPDIHSWFEEHWMGTMYQAGNSEFVQKRFKALRKFCADTIEKLEDFQENSIDGVRILR